jgi:shikimate dehydrogenase
MSEAYGLVGSPIEHSPSPAMHNAALRSCGLEAEYRLRPAEPEDATEVINELKGGLWRGLNVTTPLKTLLAPLVELTGHAVRARAVNTLWVEDGTVVGALTDVDGVLEPLRQAGCFGPGQGLILGAGGAARAAALALETLGHRVHVACRRPEAGQELLDTLQLKRPGEAMSLSSAGDAEALFAELSVVVQCTPVGRDRGRHRLPWDQARQGLVAFEMLYLPVCTPFVAEAKRNGCHTIGGWRMLLHQGAQSFKLWTGLAAPIEAMEQALLKQLDAQVDGGQFSAPLAAPL